MKVKIIKSESEIGKMFIGLIGEFIKINDSTKKAEIMFHDKPMRCRHYFWFNPDDYEVTNENTITT